MLAHPSYAVSLTPALCALPLQLRPRLPLPTSREKNMATKKKSAAKKSPAKKTAAKKSGGRKYSPGAGKSVEREMKAMKKGTLKSGRSGKKVTSKKQAIAIGLSE